MKRPSFSMKANFFDSTAVCLVLHTIVLHAIVLITCCIQARTNSTRFCFWLANLCIPVLTPCSPKLHARFDKLFFHPAKSNKGKCIYSIHTSRSYKVLTNVCISVCAPFSVSYIHHGLIFVFQLRSLVNGLSVVYKSFRFPFSSFQTYWLKM